jgi:hypothetical protein
MSEPVKIVIVLDGGLVQGVITAGVPVEYVVVDYDTDSPDPADLVAVPQNRGRESDDVEKAYVGEPYDADVDGPWVLAAHTDRFGWDKPYSTEALKLFDSGDLTDEETITALGVVGWAEHRARVILEEHKADGA